MRKRTSSSRYVLAIDPGTHLCGYALVEVLGPSRFRPQALGVIAPEDAGLARRLGHIMSELIPIVDDAYKLEADCVVERPFVNQNFQATLQIAGARGVALAVIGAAGLPFFEYWPQQWKAVTGNGRATKMQVANVVKALLRLDYDPPLDAADAGGMAIFHGSKIA